MKEILLVGIDKSDGRSSARTRRRLGEDESRPVADSSCTSTAAMAKSIGGNETMVVVDDSCTVSKKNEINEDGLGWGRKGWSLQSTIHNPKQLASQEEAS